MRRSLVVALLVLASAQAQTPQEQYPRHRISNTAGQTANVNSNRLDALASDTLVRGSITSTQSVTVDTQGRSNVRITITGTWTGTIVFEGSIDGTNWVANGGLPFPVTLGGGAIVGSTSVNGNWEARCAGFRLYRMRGATVTSGTAAVSINASAGNDYSVSNIIDDGYVFTTYTTPLAAGATWTSATIDMLPFISESSFVYSDVPSAKNGALVQTSHDGVTWFNDHQTSYGGGTPQTFRHTRRARYARVQYTNGATPQSVFVYQIILQRASIQQNYVHLNQGLYDDDSGLLNRSILTGRTAAGGYVNAQTLSTGALVVGYPDSVMSAYGKQFVAEMDLAVSILWTHGINTRLVTTSTAAGGTAAWVSGTTVVSLQTSVNPAGSASVESLTAARFTPQQSVRVVFSVPSNSFSCVVGNARWVGAGDTSNGYFFGCDPTTGTFGLMYRNPATGDHFIPQTAWNTDKLDGNGSTGFTLDPTKSNFYVIDFRQGTGTTSFYVVTTGKIPSLVHELAWRNTSGTSGVTNAILPLHAENRNVGSTANNELRIGPMALLTESGSDPVGTSWAYSNRKNNVPNGVETNIFTLQNNATWNGTGGPSPNKVRLRLQSISLSAVGGGAQGNAECDIRLDPTVAGSTIFTDVNANNSIASVDTAGTTVSAGSYIYTVSLVTGSAHTIDLVPLRFRLNPGERWSFNCQGDGNAVDARFGANWVEEW